jgi:hypothetical protein
MDTNYAILAEEYYKLVGTKNAEAIKKYLDADVEFHSPLTTLKGRDAVLEATSNFMKAFKSLKIRAKFGAGNQAMIVYDTDIPGIAENFPGASLLSFRDGLIVKIELFHDASRFAKEF